MANTENKWNDDDDFDSDEDDDFGIEHTPNGTKNKTKEEKKPSGQG